MTISSTQSKTIYAGNGSTKAFAIPFMFPENEDIEVTLLTQGEETILTISTDYHLSGAGEQNGGVCTLTIAPGVGETLVIRRNPSLIQEVDYVENDAFPAATHEAALDKLTMICQALAERLDRTITFRVSSAVTGVELPEPDSGQLLAWNESGDNLTNRAAADIGAVLLPLDVSLGGTGAENITEAQANLGFGPTARALAAAANTTESLEILNAEPANSAILKADTSATLEAGFSANAKPMTTAAPTPASGALQVIDTSAGAVSLGVPVAAGIIRFMIVGGNAINPSASYDSIDGSYDPAVGLAQGEIVSNGTKHMLTIVNRVTA